MDKSLPYYIMVLIKLSVLQIKPVTSFYVNFLMFSSVQLALFIGCQIVIVNHHKQITNSSHLTSIAIFSILNLKLY